MPSLKASFLASFALSALLVAGSPAARAPPSISLNGGTFVGTSGNGVQKFLGIPYAQPPCVLIRHFCTTTLTCCLIVRVGNLRFQLPQSIASYSGTYDASKFGQSCPQHGGGLPSLGGLASEAADWLSGSIFNPDRAGPQAEDCQSS
jgi:acetylcholinesterase